jgi:hypothetical protein
MAEKHSETVERGYETPAFSSDRIAAPVLRWKERLAGHVGNAERDRVRDDDRNAPYMFPAVAMAVISAILVAAQE